MQFKAHGVRDMNISDLIIVALTPITLVDRSDPTDPSSYQFYFEKRAVGFIIRDTSPVFFMLVWKYKE